MSPARRLGFILSVLAVVMIGLGVTVGLMDLSPSADDSVAKDSPDSPAAKVAPAAPAVAVLTCLHWMPRLPVDRRLEDSAEPAASRFPVSVRSPRPPPLFLS